MGDSVNPSSNKDEPINGLRMARIYGFSRNPAERHYTISSGARSSTLCRSKMNLLDEPKLRYDRDGFLSPIPLFSVKASGCMRVIPGSHLKGKLNHQQQHEESNILFQGQTVQVVDESNVVYCPLLPGEASFHLHSSQPNQSDDRRIG